MKYLVAWIYISSHYVPVCIEAIFDERNIALVDHIFVCLLDKYLWESGIVSTETIFDDWSNKEVCISIPADDLNNVVLVKGTDIWEDRISISLLAEFDIISDILSIDVFPFVPECDADDFVLAEDMVVIVDFAEIDIISDILSIDVFPYVPEGERDNFVLADDTAVLVDSLCTCLSDILETCSIYEDFMDDGSDSSAVENTKVLICWLSIAVIDEYLDISCTKDLLPVIDVITSKALVIIDELDVIKCDAEARKDGYNDVMLAAIVIELTDWKYDEIDWLSSTEFVSTTCVLLGVIWFTLVDGVIAGILDDDVDIDIGEYVSTRIMEELDLDDIIVDDEYSLKGEMLLS